MNLSVSSSFVFRFYSLVFSYICLVPSLTNILSLSLPTRKARIQDPKVRKMQEKAQQKFRNCVQPPFVQQHSCASGQDGQSQTTNYQNLAIAAVGRMRLETSQNQRGTTGNILSIFTFYCFLVPRLMIPILSRSETLAAQTIPGVYFTQFVAPHTPDRRESVLCTCPTSTCSNPWACRQCTHTAPTAPSHRHHTPLT